jgi:dimethylargininase
MQQCELTYQARVEIDLALANAQHRVYEQALEEFGCQVISLPAEPDLPDSVFVEDVALVMEDVAVLTRPGAASRRPEVPSVACVLAEYRRLEQMTAPAALDGGDVLRLGRTLYVGVSTRSSHVGIEQLAGLLAPYGYQVEPVELSGCLHLKSAVTQVGADLLLINRQWIPRVPRGVFASFRCVEVHPQEPQAGNALMLPGGLIYPSSYPLTRHRLEQCGLNVRAVDVSEMEKAEGAVTCCSLVFEMPANGRLPSTS